MLENEEREDSSGQYTHFILELRKSTVLAESSSFYFRQSGWYHNFSIYPLILQCKKNNIIFNEYCKLSSKASVPNAGDPGLNSGAFS